MCKVDKKLNFMVKTIFMIEIKNWIVKSPNQVFEGR